MRINVRLFVLENTLRTSVVEFDRVIGINVVDSMRLFG